MPQAIAPIIPTFLTQFPAVNLHILSTNAPVDLIEPRIDVALRVRSSPDGDMSLTTRALATNLRIMVAAPAVAALVGSDADPSILPGLSTLSFTDQADVWEINCSGQKSVGIRIRSW